MKEEIRRVDLRLRARYPHLNTEILQISPFHFAIVVSNPHKPFLELAKEFDNEIRFITAPVSLLEERPIGSHETIDSIDDESLSDGYAGLPLTRGQILLLVNSSNPEIPVRFVDGVEGDGNIKFYAPGLSSDQKIQLQNFIAGLALPVNYRIVEDQSEVDARLERERTDRAFLGSTGPLGAAVNMFDSPVLGHVASRIRFGAPEFEKRDEAFWFDRNRDIYCGRLNRLEIAGTSQEEQNCFIDYSLNTNVNLRNGILLYDKVYVSLPIDRPASAFLEEQKLTKNEFLDLVASKRLKVLVTQPSDRQDIALLNAAFEADVDAVLGRRRISALLLADFRSINKRYFLNELGAEAYLPAIAEDYSKMLKLGYRETYDFLAWPIAAYRGSFEHFSFESSKSIGAIGVSSVVSKIVTAQTGRNLDLEFFFNAENSHISHSLDATLFPSFAKGQQQNDYFSSTIGNLLKLYSNMTMDDMGTYLRTRGPYIHRKKTISPIDLLEVNEYIPIDEMLSFIDQFRIPRRLGAILGYLASLDEPTMNSTLERYNKELQKLTATSGKKKTGLDLAVALGSDLAGTAIPALGTILAVGDKIAGGTKIKEKLQRLAVDIGHGSSSAADDHKNVRFLSKINSVARLKRKY